MPRLILFDGRHRDHLLPFTYLMPSAEIRVGGFSICEKWEADLDIETRVLPVDYLKDKFAPEWENDNFVVEGNVIPGKDLIVALTSLKPNSILLHKDIVVAGRLDADNMEKFARCEELNVNESTYDGEVDFLSSRWHIFTKNGPEIEWDIKRLSPNAAGEDFMSTNFVTLPEQIYIGKDVKCRNAFIDATNGPVYLGNKVKVEDGAMIKGPAYIGDHSTVKMGAKIYGPSSCGPWCKLGGEINNSVFHSYSNKAHEGFLGNSVIGQWCNIGADTNNSNLKNNYEEVKVWDYTAESFSKTGLQFCGLFMGDHTKCGINTMFNTGTTIGVSSNIFGGGFPRTFIPSFSWGGASGLKEFRLDKATEAAERMMQRRSIDFTEADKKIFEHVFNITQKFRS